MNINNIFENIPIDFVKKSVTDTISYIKESEVTGKFLDISGFFSAGGLALHTVASYSGLTALGMVGGGTGIGFGIMNIAFPVGGIVGLACYGLYKVVKDDNNSISFELFDKIDEYSSKFGKELKNFMKEKTIEKNGLDDLKYPHNGNYDFFDSFLELEFAEFLDKNNIEWEFEPFCVKYGNDNHYYYPDFYLPKLNIFVEVKSKVSEVNNNTIEKLQSAIKTKDKSEGLFIIKDFNWDEILKILQNKKEI